LTLAAPLLALGVFALLGWGDEPVKPTPELEVWKVLIAAQAAAWTIFLGIGIRGLGRLDVRLRSWAGDDPARRARWRLETVRFIVLVYGTISVLLVLGGIAGIRNPDLLWGQAWKIALLHALAGAAASPFFVGLKRVQLSAEDDALWSGSARDIEQLQSFRRYLRTATASMGTTVALAVVSTGALRTAVEAASRVPLPEEFVVVYGAFLTGVVGATYVYVFSSIEARGRSILQAAAPLPDPDLASAEGFSAAVSLRGELAQVLELGGDPRKNLEGLIAVFAPLIGALITGVGRLGG
jgi:hypothetical protein